MNAKGLYNYYASHPESGWIMKPEKGAQLYDFVKHNNIKNILDLGTGIGLSAAIMALALNETGRKDGHIHTVEQFEKCYKIAQDILPPDLKPYVTFHLKQPKVWQDKNAKYFNFSTFQSLPKGKFDLIVCDGPGPWPEGEGDQRQMVELPNGDVMKLLVADKLPKGTLIAWDGRISALNLLERFYGDNFMLVHQGQGTNFNVLERKDNPVHFSDNIYERFKNDGYER